MIAKSGNEGGFLVGPTTEAAAAYASQALEKIFAFDDKDRSRRN
jgi:hypothetical protein